MKIDGRDRNFKVIKCLFVFDVYGIMFRSFVISNLKTMFHEIKDR